MRRFEKSEMYTVIECTGWIIASCMERSCSWEADTFSASRKLHQSL